MALCKYALLENSILILKFTASKLLVVAKSAADVDKIPRHNNRNFVCSKKFTKMHLFSKKNGEVIL